MPVMPSGTGHVGAKMAVFCTQCGTPLEDGDRFCTNCGASCVDEVASTVPEDVPAQPVEPVDQTDAPTPAEEPAESAAKGNGVA
ncbi:MAG: hypothetical protein DBY20_04595, partial [Coriobacteriia bacterium]